MPLITVPFEKVGIDIVGPLVQAMTQHKLILVLVDYVTPYPEDILLQNMQAETVAKVLAQIFTRIGEPQAGSD